MKTVAGEKIITVVKANRKGRGTNKQTAFEIGIGIVLDEQGNPTGKIRIRTEQIESGVAPVVGTIQLDKANTLCEGFIDSISLATKR